jgi:NAD(P)-dependent dehydrogenase (short-subunit alcohol dehydrogenase family)
MAQAECDQAGMARTIEISKNAAIMEPSDIAALALYLASDEARYITGAIMSADGGLSAR